MKKPNVVIDTQVFLRAAGRSASLSHKIVYDLSPKFQVISSPEIRAEVVDVLNRPDLRRKFPELTDKQVTLILEFLDSGVQVIPDEIPRISRDIKDDVFLAVAQMSDADYLVTEDNDLLVLKTHGKTKIINALAFLDVLQQLED